MSSSRVHGRKLRFRVMGRISRLPMTKTSVMLPRNATDSECSGFSLAKVVSVEEAMVGLCSACSNSTISPDWSVSSLSSYAPTPSAPVATLFARAVRQTPFGIQSLQVKHQSMCTPARSNLWVTLSRRKFPHFGQASIKTWAALPMNPSKAPFDVHHGIFR